MNSCHEEDRNRAGIESGREHPPRDMNPPPPPPLRSAIATKFSEKPIIFYG
eukprot:gene26009-biopygen12876